MIQHPIPQNVTQYQFRLIGDMTINQFIYLAIGIAGAVFFYYTNLFFILKWLLVALSAMGGFGVAFLPIEDRPMEIWIMNFVRAIYRPTEFVFKKGNPIPAYFEYTPYEKVNHEQIAENARLAQIRRDQGLQSYLVSLPKDEIVNEMDKLEDSKLDSVLSMFNNSQTSIINVSQSDIGINDDSTVGTGQNQIPLSQQVNLNPQQGVISLDNPIPDQTLTENSTEQNIATENQTEQNSVETIINNSVLPSTPSLVNTIVGMIRDGGNLPIENVMVTIEDEIGVPVRITKTNRLGHFYSTTPLSNGSYVIKLEKNGQSFDTIKLNLSGQIIEPLMISASKQVGELTT